MNNKIRLLASVAAVGAVMAASGAQASTLAGTDITNNVSVAFNVNGFAQTAAVDSDVLKVDRKVTVVVAEPGNATTTVSPNETNAVTTFTVTNNSNAPLDFALGVTQLAGGTAAHGGTDTFNLASFTIYKETNSIAGWQNTDTVVTYLDEVPMDGGSNTVYVVGPIPTGLATGAVAGVVLTATSQAGGGAGTQGATLTQDTGANGQNTMETVFADTAGTATGDVARDGKHSAGDDYTVLAAALTAEKVSRVVSDPVNNTTNPKAIPGAVVEYCIKVANASGSATATNVTITDAVPGQMTFVAGSIRVDGTVDVSNNCNLDGTAGGSFASPNVTGTLSNIAAGVTRTLRFQATIN